MSKLRYYFIAGPFIVIGIVVEFIVWEFFSDGRWKQRKVQSSPVIHWQNEALAARRQLRELEYKSRREKVEMESTFREELKRKERQVIRSERS